METGPVYVGIDVSKVQLDVAERPSGERAVIPHTEEGIATLVAQLRIRRPACVVLEATGGLQVPLASALAVGGIPVAVVNPRQVRDFAKATGQLAKTDAIDAQVLARFADAVRPTPRPLPDEATQQLGALLTRRRQLIEMLVAEQQRMQRAPHPIQRQFRPTSLG
jgi:transposase